MSLIRNRKNERLRTIAVAIIGVLMLLSGLGISNGSYSTYTDYQASQKWPQINTVIKELDFIENEDETFSVNVSYTYSFKDKNYTNQLENYFEYDEQKARKEYQKLEALFEKKSGWKVFINPQKPKANFEEIVFPDTIFLLLLVASVFMLFGLGLLYTAIKLLLVIKEEKKLQSVYPTEPWKWNSMWNSRVIYSERRSSIPVYLFMLIFWLQLTAFFIYIGYSDPPELNFGLGVAAVMSVAGVIFILLVIKSQLKLYQHGQSILEPLTFPGDVGREFKAVIKVPFQLNPEDDILFNIDCVKHYTSHDLRGKAQSRTNLLWKESFTVPKKEVKTEADMTIISFSISIPADLPDANDDGVTWSLSASAKRETLDWNESFPLPIFHPKSNS